jgi:hypothetical protein
MTDGQSVSLSWRQAPSGAQKQICVTIRQLWVCWCGAPSLRRGRVCILQLLLALDIAVILGSDSCGTHDHILLSQIRHSPTWGPGPGIDVPQDPGDPIIPHTLCSHFRRLLRLAGIWLKYSNPLPCEQSKSKLFYDWRFTANNFLLAPSSSRLTTRFF